ncbi:uncharacterized protein LTR77_004814 [Saxophila tyrrhenica]|uniref:Major facilitator superfamily (MFS) profile domain-containing protein n=1 Tax=Saxophila tyrrhenica TaxID=1690608 RepID=A0AAV9PEH2_9PEZI|nr:hypothetical protein LTR77_004814 [Saxophila tyrrhenica]
MPSLPWKKSRSSTLTEKQSKDVVDHHDQPTDNKDTTTPSDAPSSPSETTRPTGLRLILLFLSLSLAVLLCALDGTIIATAIPTITAHFDSLDDYSWYNSAFLLTTCAFQLPFGRAYSLVSTKWTFVFAIVVFEVGSAISGAAPTSLALIVGRAVQGLGCSGIFGGAFVIIAETTPLDKRALFNGFLGVNLPLGAVTLFVVALFLPPIGNAKGPIKKDGQTWFQVLLRFDPIGTLILVPSIISLLLALQWGGITYAWSDPVMIGLLVCFGVSILMWVAVQWWMGDDATIPGKVIKQRTVIFASGYMLFGAAAFMVAVYYLPVWFQAIKGASAVQSGINSLALILAVVIASIAAGGAVVLIGYYVPFLLLGTICMSVGAGLLMTLTPSSGKGAWIGYQILFGAGIGMSLEQCSIAVQTVLPEHLVASGTSLAVFARSFGGSISIAIAENVFQQELRERLANTVPGLNLEVISGSGATDLVADVTKATDGNQRIVDEVLREYSGALTQTFLVAVVLSALTGLFALGVEWKSVKKDKKNKKEGEDDSKADDEADAGQKTDDEKKGDAEE